MEKIRWARVLLGGLVAGVVVNAFILFPMLAVFGLPISLDGSETTTVTVLMAALVFLMTVPATWLYATIRPRYGAGMKTAALSGIVLGLLFCLFQMIAWILASRPIPPMVLAISAAITFVLLFVAALLGAWIYDKPGS